MNDKLYIKTLERLVEKYKTAIDQCLDVISREIGEDLADEKLYNVLKAKRVAGEDVKFYAKEIQLIENELSGNDQGNVNPRSARKKYIKQ